MALFEAFSHIFILRLWREPREIERAEVEWRGEVEPLLNGEKRYFRSLEEIAPILGGYLERTPGAGSRNAASLSVSGLQFW